MLCHYCVLTMYLDRGKISVKGKTYQRVLLRQSYRENGKVKHRTIANLSSCSEQEIQAIDLAFKHKKDLDALKPNSAGPLHLRQGLCFGAVWVLYQVAEREGIVAALGNERQGKLALWQAGQRRGWPRWRGATNRFRWQWGQG